MEEFGLLISSTGGFSISRLYSRLNCEERRSLRILKPGGILVLQRQTIPDISPIDRCPIHAGKSTRCVPKKLGGPPLHRESATVTDRHHRHCLLRCLIQAPKNSAPAFREVGGPLTDRHHFACADAIRAQLTQAGIIVEDTKDGIRWKRK